MAKTTGKQPVTTRPFGVVLRDLLLEHGYVTGLGNPNWRQFSLELDDVEDGGKIQYESLRKAATGERPPSPKIMKSIAAKFGIEPTVFWEYQAWEAQRSFDPREVGEETALANLQAWLAQR